MPTVDCHIKHYIQPFERHLAIDELRALTAAEPVPIDGSTDRALHFRVTTAAKLTQLKDELAYWQSVGIRQQEITTQLKSEATLAIARNGVALKDIPKVVSKIIESNLPTKRCLRYGTHGLHEYRGKFFPQLVRALMNVGKIPAKGTILDPMCGSGTTLVEAALSGRYSYGLDLNPLSVFVSKVKCDALSIEPKVLIKSFQTLSESVSRNRAQSMDARSHFVNLSRVDQEYLLKWFAASTLQELDHIQKAIRNLRVEPVRNLYMLCLSNILRRVSWQNADDLRIRKEVVRLRKGEVIDTFLRQTLRSTKAITAFNVHRGGKRIGNYFVRETDARDCSSALSPLVGKVDAVITSPPYATALPYLDTDRLSLIYLGLLPRPEHRPRDLLMIGNREITERGRRTYWNAYERNCGLLPESTQKLIERIDTLNKTASVGFRRRNLSALLAKYFFDMREVMAQQLRLLRSDGIMFMVVGNNRTAAGGINIEIETAHHLGCIAESLGFRVVGNRSMEMLISRDIFQKNAVASEQILILEKY
jgi:DNA modification methylase